MWAEIDENGGLVIVPESPVEVFALGVWADELKNFESKYTIRIVRSVEERGAIKQEQK